MVLGTAHLEACMDPAMEGMVTTQVMEGTQGLEDLEGWGEWGMAEAGTTGPW